MTGRKGFSPGRGRKGVSSIDRTPSCLFTLPLRRFEPARGVAYRMNCCGTGLELVMIQPGLRQDEFISAAVISEIPAQQAAREDPPRR
jgi:hypothetical protein